MNGIIQIKYGTQVNIDEAEYKYEIEEIDFEREFESEEEREQYQQEKAAEEKFAKSWDTLWKNLIRKEEVQIKKYTIGNGVIKYERSQNKMPDEYIRLKAENGLMQHFYKDKKTGEPRLTEFKLHENTTEGDWKITYRVERNELQKKNILGYDCTKVIIEETSINEANMWENIRMYELFVTNEIELPARLIIPLRDYVIEECALEIKTISMKSKSKKSVIIDRVIEIENNIEKTELELPKEYQNLLRNY